MVANDSTASAASWENVDFGAKSLNSQTLQHDTSGASFPSFKIHSIAALTALRGTGCRGSAPHSDSPWIPNFVHSMRYLQLLQELRWLFYQFLFLFTCHLPFPLQSPTPSHHLLKILLIVIVRLRLIRLPNGSTTLCVDTCHEDSMK